ncbi:MAG: hypothetical protein JJ847_02150 [Prochlorococcus marinus CUG1438]|nr:hypothetical protein [Prochlorococcus marinus CUG1438]|tara:strand:+ start:304 stop:447 length:144 start_codon:yes stop_codon:yes gene_type:complete
MSEKISSNDIENDELDFNTEESDYENLITRLKEIRSTIAVLKKTIFR